MLAHVVRREKLPGGRIDLLAPRLLEGQAKRLRQGRQHVRLARRMHGEQDLLDAFPRRLGRDLPGLGQLLFVDLPAFQQQLFDSLPRRRVRRLPKRFQFRKRLVQRLGLRQRPSRVGSIGGWCLAAEHGRSVVRGQLSGKGQLALYAVVSCPWSVVRIRGQLSVSYLWSVVRGRC